MSHLYSASFTSASSFDLGFYHYSATNLLGCFLGLLRGGGD
jgi:hypothetical protein